MLINVFDSTGSTIRVGVVAFRDFISDNPLQSLDLTSDLAAVTAFIASLETQSGGDFPEDVAGGLEEVMRLSWDNNKAAKCLLWVGDAPGHGKEYWGPQMKDSHESISAIEKRALSLSPYPDLKEQIAMLAFNGFDFFAIEADKENTAIMFDKLERAFRDQAAIDGRARTFQRIEGINGDTDYGTFFSDIVMRSASSSLLANISSTIGSGGAPTAAPVPRRSERYGYLCDPKLHSRLMFTPPPVPLDTKAVSRGGGKVASAVSASADPGINFVPATRYTIRFLLKDMPKPGASPVDWAKVGPYLKKTSVETTVLINPVAFGRGAMRSAYLLNDSKMPGKDRVAKIYYVNGGEENETDEAVQRDAYTQAVTKALAMAFSIDDRHNNVVDCLTTCYYELDEELEMDGVPVKFFSSEPKMTGSYQKYNNNGGYVAQPGLTGSAAASLDVAQAFSHFTYQYTHGKLLVCDIQGHNDIYTDPQIHSLSRTGGQIKESDKLVYGKGDASKMGKKENILYILFQLFHFKMC